MKKIILIIFSFSIFVQLTSLQMMQELMNLQIGYLKMVIHSMLRKLIFAKNIKNTVKNGTIVVVKLIQKEKWKL